MPLTKHVRLPVTDDELAELEKRAGGVPITAFLRKLLGLQPRKQGRPSKPRK